MKRVTLELSNAAAEALEDHVDETLSGLLDEAEKNEHDANVRLIRALLMLKYAIGGDSESAKNAGRSLRSARRIS